MNANDRALCLDCLRKGKARRMDVLEGGDLMICRTCGWREESMDFQIMEAKGLLKQYKRDEQERERLLSC